MGGPTVPDPRRRDQAPPTGPRARPAAPLTCAGTGNAAARVGRPHSPAGAFVCTGPGRSRRSRTSATPPDPGAGKARAGLPGPLCARTRPPCRVDREEDRTPAPGGPAPHVSVRPPGARRQVAHTCPGGSAASGPSRRERAVPGPGGSSRVFPRPGVPGVPGTAPGRPAVVRPRRDPTPPGATAARDRRPVPRGRPEGPAPRRTPGRRGGGGLRSRRHADQGTSATRYASWLGSQMVPSSPT